MCYKTTNKEQETSFIKEIIKENPDWVKNRRCEFLESEIRELNKDLIFWIEQINKYLNKYPDWFGIKIHEICFAPRFKKIKRLYSEIELYKNPIFKENKNKLSESEIEIAREYLFENLIEIKKNFALCPFHNDKHPSFYTKNNYGYCFSCGWKGDIIKFIMERDNLNFKEAVLFLNSKYV